MLTIFSIPKPFRDHINVIQRNALQSWLCLSPKPEIILFGNELGISEAAREFDVRHFPEIEKNKFATPLLNSAFNAAQKLAKNNLLVYINSDIILMSDFIPAVKRVKQRLFLLSGRRKDLDIREEVNFNDNKWEEKLSDRVVKEGKLHGFSGIDYFVFPCALPHNLPPFAVGRPGWDNWLIYKIRSLGIPVIDATPVIRVVHQNHSYSHCIGGKRDKGPEAKRNFDLARGFSNMMSLRDADWILAKKDLERPGFPRRIFVQLSLFYPWRLALAMKRRIQQLLK